MIRRYFVLLFFFIALLSFSFSLSFPGKTISFKDLNMPLIFNGDSVCASIDLSSADKDLLVNTPGVLGLLLHIKSGAPTSFVSVRSDLGMVYTKNIYGFNIKSTHYLSEAQNHYLYIDLQPARSGNLDFYLCTSSKSKIEFYEDSQIGSYKLPYFGGSNFTKAFKNHNYKINEKTPVLVTLKNSGFADANVFIFYDNELFTKWFSLKNGTPSLNQNLKPGQSTSLEYNVVPLTDKSFTISPAVARYTVNGYVFTEYSNGFISNARNYLDELFVNVDFSAPKVDLNENETIKVGIYNDSNKNKNVELLVSGLEQFGLSDIYPVTLKPSETKTLSFDVNSSKNKMVKFKVYLAMNDVNNTKKLYDSQTVYFGNPINNYNYIFVIFAIVLVVGVIVYYKYGL